MASTNETPGPFFVTDRDMVKLEDADGEVLYVNPSMVVSLSKTGVDGLTRVCVPHDTEHVKGTPDEVHAKLFPEVEPEKAWVPAGLEVLRWAAEAKGPWDDRLRVLARTALGWPLD